MTPPAPKNKRYLLTLPGPARLSQNAYQEIANQLSPLVGPVTLLIPFVDSPPPADHTTPFITTPDKRHDSGDFPSRTTVSQLSRDTINTTAATTDTLIPDPRQRPISIHHIRSAKPEPLADVSAEKSSKAAAAAEESAAAAAASAREVAVTAASIERRNDSAAAAASRAAVAAESARESAPTAAAGALTAVKAARAAEAAAAEAVEAVTQAKETVATASALVERTEERLRYAEALRKAVEVQAIVQETAQSLTKAAEATFPPSLPVGDDKTLQGNQRRRLESFPPRSESGTGEYTFPAGLCTLKHDVCRHTCVCEAIKEWQIVTNVQHGYVLYGGEVETNVHSRGRKTNVASLALGFTEGQTTVTRPH